MTIATTTAIGTYREIEEGGPEQDDSQQEGTGGFQHLQTERKIYVNIIT